MKSPFSSLLQIKRQHRLNIERVLDARLNQELVALRTVEPPPHGLTDTLQAVRAVGGSVHFTSRKKTPKLLLCQVLAAFLLFSGISGIAYWTYIEWEPSWPAIERTPPLVTQLLPATTARNAYDTYRTVAPSIDLYGIGQLPHFDKLGNWEKQIRYPYGNKIDPDNSEAILAMAQYILRKNARQLTEVRQALTSSYSDPDSARNTDEMIEDKISQFRKIYALLMLDAMVASTRKNDALVANNALDALQFVTQLQTSTNFIGKLTYMAWEAPARDFLWDVLPNLDAASLKQTIKRLDTVWVFSLDAALRLVLENERLNGRQTLQKLFRSPGWRWQMGSSLYSNNTGYRNSLMNTISMLRYSKQQITDNHEALVNQQIKLSGMPYAQSKGKWKSLTEGDPINKMLSIEMEYTFFRETFSRLQNQMLITSASLYLYHHEHDVYPKNLDALLKHQDNLVNQYYRPKDMFAWRDKPTGDLKKDTHFELTYVPKPNGFLLYSLGPDGEDNGGKPIVNERLSQGRVLSHVVSSSLHGDVVAGINRRCQ